ncbi:MAG: hypothetical protein EPO20_11490 [Betaproteobacteria bacterium]|nr:MAG: hypothetical protein EPO20_11490 [Betaproteobacteria bacterium]
MLAVLRIVGLAVAVVLGICILSWILTGERKWLRIAWVVFKYAVFALALVLALFAGEALLRG